MTVVIWIIIGALAGLLSRVVMQVPNDRGNAVAVAVGIVGAFVAGAIAAVYMGSAVIAINPLLIACGTNGALYTLFGYRCLAMRGR
jgi:uncharacterized membrane protein YeaQ/YmgE (transglycosylase-associated protein family)